MDQRGTVAVCCRRQCCRCVNAGQAATDVCQRSQDHDCLQRQREIHRSQRSRSQTTAARQRSLYHAVHARSDSDSFSAGRKPQRAPKTAKSPPLLRYQLSHQYTIMCLDFFLGTLYPCTAVLLFMPEFFTVSGTCRLVSLLRPRSSCEVL